MNAGEVENPGAFDSEEKTAKTTPVGEGTNPPEPNQTIDPDEPIGDDGVNYDVYADGPEASGTITANDTNIEFSAEDIRNRKKTNYFVNIKDADKLKREADRKHAAEEKRILAEQRRAEKQAAQAEKAAAAKRRLGQKYNDAQEKNALKEVAANEKRQRKIAAAERRKQRCRAIRHGIANFFYKVFWHSWHKIITIAFFIGLAVFAVLAYRSYQYYLKNILPKEQKTQAIRETKAQYDKDSFEFFKELNQRYQQNDNNGYDDACKWANEVIAEAKEKESPNLFMYSLVYAKFIVQHVPLDWDKSVKLIDDVSNLANDDYSKYELYHSYIVVYSYGEDTSMVDYYNSLLDELHLTTEGEGALVYE